MNNIPTASSAPLVLKDCPAQRDPLVLPDRKVSMARPALPALPILFSTHRSMNGLLDSTQHECCRSAASRLERVILSAEDAVKKT